MSSSLFEFSFADCEALPLLPFDQHGKIFRRADGAPSESVQIYFDVLSARRCVFFSIIGGVVFLLEHTARELERWSRLTMTSIMHQ